MPFIDIARATYTYSPQSNDELFIEEEDLLYVLEKGEDDWWKVKKKVAGDDDGPIGLVPRNYLENVNANEYGTKGTDTGRYRRYRLRGHCMTILLRQRKSCRFLQICQWRFTTRMIRIGTWSDLKATSQRIWNMDLYHRITLMMGKSRALQSCQAYCRPVDLIPWMREDLLHHRPNSKKNRNRLVLAMLYFPLRNDNNSR